MHKSRSQSKPRIYISLFILFLRNKSWEQHEQRNKTYLENIYDAANQYAFITWFSFLPETKGNNTLPMKFKYIRFYQRQVTIVLKVYYKTAKLCWHVKRSLHVRVCPLFCPPKIEGNDDEKLTQIGKEAESAVTEDEKGEISYPSSKAWVSNLRPITLWPRPPPVQHRRKKVAIRHVTAIYLHEFDTPAPENQQQLH